MKSTTPSQNARSNGSCSRRDALKLGSAAAAGTVLTQLNVPKVHAGEDSTIRLALIGTGGRGCGAVGNAVGASRLKGAGCFGPVKLVAMADVFQHRLDAAHRNLSKAFPKHVDVPAERKFQGFDAYRKAIDCLRPGDVAMLTAHAGFRRVHMDYAVDKGINVFMEKSFAPDPGGLKRMLRAGERAEKKNLKIASGLMCRHSPARQALIHKIRDGELGQILMMNAYRLGPGAGLPPRPADKDELLWQVGRPGVGHLLWASSGRMIELLIHQIDECCWIKDAWPVSVHGLGGRVPGMRDCGQNHHSYAMEYTFADGSKALVDNRNTSQCHDDFVTYLHGTKRAAQFSRSRAPQHRAHLQGPGPRSQRYRLAGPAGITSPAPIRMGSTARRHPQRQAPQRNPAGNLRQPGLDHGPRRRTLGKDHHLERRPGLRLRVREKCRRPRRRQPRPRQGRQKRLLPLPGAGAMDGDLDWRCGSLSARDTAQKYVLVLQLRKP